MTVEIDQATGLPKLPDGDWWQVAPLWGQAIVRWMHMQPAGRWTEWGAWRDSRNDTEYEYEERVVTVKVARRGFFGSREVDEEQRQVRKRLKTLKAVRRSSTLLVPLDQAAILSAAINMVEERDAERNAATLLGDYPPKRLQP